MVVVISIWRRAQESTVRKEVYKGGGTFTVVLVGASERRERVEWHEERHEVV